MTYMPTPEQMAILEKTRSFKERENLVEMWELEALAMQPADQPEPPVAPAIPAPESKVVETVTQPQEPVVEPPPVEEPPAPVTEATRPAEDQDIEYWKKQAETWKKRKGDADRALTPAQQEASRLRKAQDELTQKYDERLSSIETLLKQMVQTKSQPNVELDPMDEIDSQYPDIARKIKATALISAQSVEERLRKEMDERTRQIEERSKRMEEESVQERQKLYAESHFAQLKAIHKDAEDFFSETKLGPALVEWVKTQPPALQSVVQYPLDHTPQDVGYVISQFKNATRYTPPKPVKPSLGDLAVKANSTTQVRQPDPEPDVFPSNFTEKDIDAQMRRLNNLFKNDPKKMDEAMDALIAKWERTVTKRNS